MNNEELKSNLLSSKHWLRLVFMLLFAVLLYLASIVVSVVVLLQFLFSLVTGQDNINIRQFGSSLSTYIFQTLKFLTYSSEEKPFPFADWPDANEDSAPEVDVAAATPAAPPAPTAPTTSADVVSGESPDAEPPVKKPRTRKAVPKAADDSSEGA